MRSPLHYAGGFGFATGEGRRWLSGGPMLDKVGAPDDGPTAGAPAGLGASREIGVDKDFGYVRGVFTLCIF